MSKARLTECGGGGYSGLRGRTQTAYESEKFSPWTRCGIAAGARRPGVRTRCSLTANSIVPVPASAWIGVRASRNRARRRLVGTRLAIIPGPSSRRRLPPLTTVMGAVICPRTIGRGTTGAGTTVRTAATMETIVATTRVTRDIAAISAATRERRRRAATSTSSQRSIRDVL